MDIDTNSSISKEKTTCDVCLIQPSPDFFDWADFMSSLLGIIASGIAIFGFYYSKKRGLRKRIFNSIIYELEYNLERDPVVDLRKLRGRTFFTFAFESAVNSGDFSYFSKETQTQLSSVYQEMKIYNQYLNNLNLADEINNMQNKELDDKKYESLDAFIDEIRSKTLKEIPKTIEMVKKEIPKHFAL